MIWDSRGRSHWGNFVNGVFRLKAWATARADQRLAHQPQCTTKETSHTEEQERGCVQQGHSGTRSSCPHVCSEVGLSTGQMACLPMQSCHRVAPAPSIPQHGPAPVYLGRESRGKLPELCEISSSGTVSSSSWHRASPCSSPRCETA